MGGIRARLALLALIVAAAVAVAASPGLAQTTQDPPDPSPDRGPTNGREVEAFLDGLVEQQLEGYEIPGATVSVVGDGEVLLSAPPLRIVLAEDSGLLRAGIARLITDAGHGGVAEAGDGPGLLSAVEEHGPDVAVVDVRMPPGFKDEGLKAALEARRRTPGLAVLVLSQYVEERYGQELLESGARGTGYLLKDRVADVAEFVSALEFVGAGGTVLDPEVIGQLLARGRHNEGLALLTPREGEVLALVAEGRTNGAIADALFVTGGRSKST